ncbi:expressed unknown protein [Seminavis robusta]|uniref:Uncharacterized protein n=1 Tax=Seminavis robusta TaxID=568900 RepID=A0A9N8DUU5_9STRA|nr:expressed unknown protein [Seminavis robusta]|eukprot:Sro375_g129500.1 n/a (462) ;mRNA; r:48587-49972
MKATTCSGSTDATLPNFATAIAVWDPNLCAGGCNQGSSSDPECSNVNAASVTWDSTVGGVYSLLVFGRQAGVMGDFEITITDFPNPSNDFCDQALPLPIDPNTVTVTTTVNATTRTTSGCGVVKQAAEVFFQVTGNGRKMTATTCHNETTYPTALSLWNPNLCAGGCNQGSTVDAACDSINGARVTWDSTDGGVYTLIAYGRQAGSEGMIGISVDDFINPPNDYCDQAIPLLPGGAEVTGTTINATVHTSSGCGVTKASPEVFYAVTGNGESMSVTTCSSQTDFETGLAIWDPNICAGACNSGSVSGCGNIFDTKGASITWDTTAGAQYTIVVFGRQEGTTGNFAIRVFDPNSTPAPSTGLPTTTSPTLTPSLTPSTKPSSNPSRSPSKSPTSTPTTATPTTSTPTTATPTTSTPTTSTPTIAPSACSSGEQHGTPPMARTSLFNSIVIMAVTAAAMNLTV